MQTELPAAADATSSQIKSLPDGPIGFQPRNLAADIARTAAILGAIAVPMANYFSSSVSPNSAIWWVASGVFSMSQWGLPLFITISGALLVGRDKRSYGDFIWQKFKRIAAALCVAITYVLRLAPPLRNWI